MMILQNLKVSYPIQGVPDDLSGVFIGAYRKVGWTPSIFGVDLYKLILNQFSGSKQIILFVDNTSGHNITDLVQSSLHSTGTKLIFPKHATDLCKATDSFIIQNIKTIWCKKRNEKRLEIIQNKCVGRLEKGSGKLPNPGKKFNFRLGADIIREVNNDRDRDVESYCRKSMMVFGLARNLNSLWDVQPLFSTPTGHFYEVSRYLQRYAGRRLSEACW